MRSPTESERRLDICQKGSMRSSKADRCERGSAPSHKERAHLCAHCTLPSHRQSPKLFRSRGLSSRDRIGVPGSSATVLCIYSTSSAAADAAPSPASVEAHVAQATRLAGDDLKALLPLCQPQPAVRASGPGLDRFLDRAIAAPSPAPGQAFDNLYYIATSWVRFLAM